MAEKIMLTTLGLIALTCSVAAMAMPDVPPKRAPAGLVPMQTSDGIMQYDRNAPHYWLVEVVPGVEPVVKVVDDYSDAEECWNATFWPDKAPSDAPWRTCLPLDEPSEGFLARVVAENF